MEVKWRKFDKEAKAIKRANKNKFFSWKKQVVKKDRQTEETSRIKKKNDLKGITRDEELTTKSCK